MESLLVFQLLSHCYSRNDVDVYLGGFNSQILSQNLFNGADSFSMMAIPFFVVAGDLMNRGGLTNKLSMLQPQLVILELV